VRVWRAIGLAEERFKEVAGDYLTVWATETRGDSEAFAQWLDQLRQAIGGEVGDLWRKDKWHTAWFDRACQDKIDEALATLRGEWEPRARRLEIQHLRNPHLTLESLCAADGDPGVAFALDQGKQALERAHSLNPPQPSGSTGVKPERLVAESTQGAVQEYAPNKLVVPVTTDTDACLAGDNPFPPGLTAGEAFDEARNKTHEQRFPDRAAWLNERLRERSLRIPGHVNIDSGGRCPQPESYEASRL
jgi:hypothetical protein